MSDFKGILQQLMTDKNITKTVRVACIAAAIVFIGVIPIFHINRGIAGKHSNLYWGIHEMFEDEKFTVIHDTVFVHDTIQATRVTRETIAHDRIKVITPQQHSVDTGSGLYIENASFKNNYNGLYMGQGSRVKIKSLAADSNINGVYVKPETK